MIYTMRSSAALRRAVSEMDFRYGIHTIELFHRVSKKDFNKVFHSLKSIRISEETQGIQRGGQRKVTDRSDIFLKKSSETGQNTLLGL